MLESAKAKNITEGCSLKYMLSFYTGTFRRFQTFRMNLFENIDFFAKIDVLSTFFSVSGTITSGVFMTF